MDYTSEAVDLASKFPFGVGDAEYICHIADVCNIPQNQRTDFIEWCAELYVLKRLPSIDCMQWCCDLIGSLLSPLETRTNQMKELITATIEASINHSVTEEHAVNILFVIRRLPEEIRTKLFSSLLEQIDKGVSVDRIMNMLPLHVAIFNPEDCESFVDDVIEDIRGHRLMKGMKRSGV